MKAKYLRISTFILLLLLSITQVYSQQEPAFSHSRMPFTGKTDGFITEWIIIGGFKSDDNFTADFLTSTGGEANIKPADGMEIKGESGSIFTWKSYNSRYNYINFFDALDGQDFYSSAIYAYTEVNSDQDKESVFSFAILGSSKIWLNGKLVHSSNEYVGSHRENTQVKVNLKKGDNRILIKSASGGWTSGFCFRIIDPENFSYAGDFVLSPKILKEKSTDNIIVIKTDKVLNPFIQQEDVNIKVRAAGGKIVKEVTAKRSEEISFNTDNWNEGTYDICFSTRDSKNELMTANILWYKGNPIDKALELIESIPDEIITRPDIVQNMLKDMIYNRLGVDDLSEAKPEDYSKIYSPLMEYEELLLEKNGEDALARENGFIRFAWIDPIDNTPQFLRVFLPMGYSPDKKYPLVIKLHGYNGSNPEYINWWSVDSRHYNILDKYNMIFAEPHGRGNTGYRGIGEKDVINCVETLVKNLSVAEDSIYLYGESMGGGGTWYIGSRHPELFAAIAPVYGGWDYRADMSKEDILKQTPREMFFNESRSGFAQADALLTTPIIVTQGDIDRAVDVKYLRFGVGMLQRWGYNVRYHEYPGFGHEGIDPYVEVVPWLKQYKLNNNPKKVRVRAAELLTAKAYWVKITQRFNPFEFVKAEAEVLKNNTIRLTTKNVAEIVLAPKSPLINPDKEITVVWNANNLIKQKLNNGELKLKDKNYKPAGMVKTPAIEGPARQITNTPFAVVIGTISDNPTMVEACKQKAQVFIDYWKQWQKFEPRVFKDTEISEDELKDYSLILYGGPADNLVVKNMADKIPLIISEDKVVIKNEEIDVKDATVKFLYPNPYNSQRYIQILAGTSVPGMFLLNRTSNDNFDFSITDGCLANKAKGRTSDKIVIARGIFDYNWNIDKNFIEYGDKVMRAEAPFKSIDKGLNVSFYNIAEVDSVKFNSYCGKYEIDPGRYIIIKREGNKLIAADPSGRYLQLIPETETEYLVEDENVMISFVEEGSRVVSMKVYQPNGNDIVAPKIK